MDRVAPWVLRALWASLPFTVGPALADGLDEASRAIQLLAAVGLWGGWAVGLVATLVPHPVALTALRLAAPAALATTVAAALAGEVSAVALGSTTAAALLSLSHPVTVTNVNGPAYANERRLPLRAPGALLAGPIPVAWALVVAGLVSGPLLLAARQWVAGSVLSVVGLLVAARLLRPLHALARRWVVFVPAGLVLHDPLTLADPVLFPRPAVESLGPALADTDAVDLTLRAPGLALELRLHEPAEIARLRPRRRETESVTLDALLFTPARPGAVLTEARQRRLPVTVVRPRDAD